MLQLLHPLKAQRLWRGLKVQPLPLRGDAEHGLPCLQLWPSPNPFSGESLGGLHAAWNGTGLSSDLRVCTLRAHSPWASQPYYDFQTYFNPIDAVAGDADGIRAQQDDEALGICPRADPCSASKGNGFS